jgi:ABC-type transport system involved in multi-copper enzyme maturation permease subunit
VLASDKWNLLILFGQAPVIGLLIYLVVGKNDPRDFPYFILALVSVWFGTSVAARELVKERPIFRRERMVNLRLLPYVASKLLVLSFIVGLQATLFFGTLKILHFAGVMYLPGLWFGLPQLLVLVLTGVVGIALGLFVSAVVKTSEVATSLVPLVLIPQILFAGLTAVPTGLARLVGSTMPATWSFDEMKRLSTLDTLKPEGSNPKGENEGKGLFEHTKEWNEKNIEEARSQAVAYANSTTETLKEHQRKVAEYIKSRSGGTAPGKPPPGPLTIGTPPPLPKPREISDDLSTYVSFLHPWGNNVLNVGVLGVMLLGLIVATMVALRMRDR